MTGYQVLYGLLGINLSTRIGTGYNLDHNDRFTRPFSTSKEISNEKVGGI